MPDSAALLEDRLARRRRARAAETIPRLEPGAAVPMSFAQWRLWFLEQLRPGTNAWNTPIAARLYGPLDLDALRDSLALLVRRHRTLRTVYPAPNGRPAPVLREAPEPQLSVLEVRAGEVEQLVHEQVRRPFDLESDPMIRAQVLRIDPEHHVLVAVVHHIACDGWSKGLLVSELNTAYEALSAGVQPTLPELPVEYGDFAAWQRASLQGEQLEALRRWWGERLRGHPHALELANDLPRPAVQQFRGAVRRLSVPGSLADTLVAVGRRERATPFMTLMAGFKAFLHARSGQVDLCVGSPSAMRTRPELERVVGLFANTLVYRTDLSGHPSFRELIGRVRETAVGVYQHQELPFEQIVEAVRPRRDPSRNPLVQANMRVEGREPELRLRGLRCEPLEIDPGLARFDLAIELSANDDGFAGYLEYDTALFSERAADAFAGDFGAILAAAAASPEAPLDRLEAMRAARAGAGA